MRFLDLFRRKKEDEASRRIRLLRTGRIVEGSMLDIVSEDAGNGTQIFYSYRVGGTVYESSQTLDSEQQSAKHNYRPGVQVTVRYDPRQPANSIVV
jgi:hypothetical protein